MTPWEYTSIADDIYLVDSQLEALGADGWELVGLTTIEARVRAYFKRPKPEKSGNAPVLSGPSSGGTK